ncbi:MAG: lipopolysaccharide biosynthesis protein [candidate division WS1 bacterium]|nr:lipopolysaccharide biosynthesis protein [candidate division WS1 bacterium]
MARSLSARVFLFTAGNVLSTASTALITILLARYLSKESMGTYQQLWLVHGLLMALLLAGLPNSMLFFVPSLPQSQQRSLLALATTVSLGLAIIVSVGMAAAAGAVATRFHNPELGELLRLFALYTFLITSVLHFPRYMVTRGKHEWAAVYQLLVAVGVLIAGLWGMAIGGGPREITIALLYTGLPVWLWGVMGLIRSWLQTPGGKSAPSRRVLRYAAQTTLAGAGSIFMQFWGPQAISLLARPAEVAVFRMGATEIPLLTTVTASVMLGLTPTLAEHYAAQRIDAMVSLWHRAIERLSGIMLPAFVYAFLMAPDVIVLLFSSKYLESATIFRIYLCALPLRTGFYGGVLQAMGRSQDMMKSTTVGCALAVASTPPLVMWLGLQGPAVSYVLGYYVIGVVFLAHISRAAHVPWRRLMPWRDLNRQLGLSALAAVVCLPVMAYRWGEHSLQLSVLRLGVSLLLYLPLCCWLFRRAGYSVAGGLLDRWWRRRRTTGATPSQVAKEGKTPSGGEKSEEEM